MSNRENSTEKRKRGSNKYWVEINGHLYARFQYKSSDGKYHTKYQPIADKRVARSTAEEMRRRFSVHGEEMLEASKLTFGQVLDRYELVELGEVVYQNGIKIKGKRSRAGVLSTLKPIRRAFGNKPVSSIKLSDIKAYKNDRIATPVVTGINVKTRGKNPITGRWKTVITKTTRSRERKIGTVNRELAWLRAVLNFAIENGWLISNPFARSKGLIVTTAEVERDRVLSFEEEARLLEGCKSERAHLKPILICALDTAMRRGEIFKMRWRDVDFVTGQIQIPQTNTKTERRRKLAMTPRLRIELEHLWRISPQDREGLVFGISNNINTSWATLCRETGINDFRFHDCRHTATTRMIASGSPHTEVMKITGHTQLKTFLRYLNITQETTNSVAMRLDEYLSRRSAKHDEGATIRGNDVSSLPH